MTSEMKAERIELREDGIKNRDIYQKFVLPVIYSTFPC
jgi:hypothetical protein